MKKGEYALERLIIKGEIARQGLLELADRLGFASQLSKSLDAWGVRFDNPIFADMEYEAPAYKDQQPGFIMKIPYRGEEQEFSRLTFSGQGSPADVQISLDQTFHPLHVIIRAK